MQKRIRGEGGKYVKKGTSQRQVRSIRMTDEVWQGLNDLADSQKITTADLLEGWILDSNVLHGQNADLTGVVKILEEALKLKPNAGGAIKSEIRKALIQLRKTM